MGLYIPTLEKILLDSSEWVHNTQVYKSKMIIRIKKSILRSYFGTRMQNELNTNILDLQTT